MKLRLWPRRSIPEPEPEAPAIETPPEPEPEAPAIEMPPEPEPAVAPAPAFARPPAPSAPEPEPPARLSLTLDEAKAAIRGAGGDVIQVGFLAGDYKRHQDEDPRSGETAAARGQLCELIAKRLRDRKLLASDGVFELREDA
jgi:hypothetical protein